MKKILILLLMMAPLSLFAQSQKFGYVNAGEVMQLMPEFSKAQNELQTLHTVSAKSATHSAPC